MACEENGCTNKTEYQIQYNDPWDFFDVCEEHLEKHLLLTFKDYDLPKTVEVTKALPRG
jgi:hypothetical protein